jgi:hypothetical protein
MSVPGSTPVGSEHNSTPKPENSSVFELISFCPEAEHRPAIVIGS